MAAAPLTSYAAGQGVQVEVFNESKPYGYSNLFHVRLRVLVRFPGTEEPYERTLERLGVSSEALSSVRGELLESFEKHSLPHLLRSDFPEKLMAHRKRERRNVVRFRFSP